MAEEPEINGGDVALDYYDYLVRYDDVKLLKGNHGLSDAIIGMYYKYLQLTLNSTSNSTTEILFASPSLTELLKLTHVADCSPFLEPLNAKQYNYVLFPLNHCESREKAGGSHWSLLAYSKMERTVCHFDSSPGTNGVVAALFAKKIMPYLCGKGPKIIREMNCPEQENGYDCGLFVLCFTDAIVQHVRTQFTIRGCGFDDIHIHIKEKRKSLLDLIENLRNQQLTNTGSCSPTTSDA